MIADPLKRFRESNSNYPEFILGRTRKIESHEMRSIEVLSEKGIKHTFSLTFDCFKKW